MHKAVMEYVDRFATAATIDILDIGGRSVNGTARELFPNATHKVLDIREGEDVDIVADAATWEPESEWDMVVSTEVFEHTADYPAICKTAFKATKAGGRFIVTCAGPGRAPHSAFIEAEPQPGEHYANVLASGLAVALRDAGWEDIALEQVGLDLRATGRKPN